MAASELMSAATRTDSDGAFDADRCCGVASVGQAPEQRSLLHPAAEEAASFEAEFLNGALLSKMNTMFRIGFTPLRLRRVDSCYSGDHAYETCCGRIDGSTIRIKRLNFES